MRPAPHRALLVVTSVRHSLRFYVGLLGGQQVSCADRSGASYDAVTGIASVRVRVAFVTFPGHDFALELVEYLSPRSQKRRWAMSDIGAVRLCFSVDDVHATARQLRRSKFLQTKVPVSLIKNGSKTADVLLLRDRDGYQIELRTPVVT